MKYDLQTVNAGVNTLKQGISLASSAISLVKNASSNKEERKFNKSVTQLEHDTALRMMKHDSNVLFTKSTWKKLYISALRLRSAGIIPSFMRESRLSMMHALIA